MTYLKTSSAFVTIRVSMQPYKFIQYAEGVDEMVQRVAIKASEGHRNFGKLLKRVYGSDEHLIVERDGFPVAVIMSFQEYEKLGQMSALKIPVSESLPPVMSLEETFGSVEPINRPEDFQALRDAAIEEKVEKFNQENDS